MVLCPPSKKSGHIALHMLVGLSVGLPSVTFLFLINNCRTPWPIFFKPGPHIHPRLLRNPIRITGSKVKVTTVKIASSYIWATYFEVTNPVVQNICDKKNLGGILFYKHLLLFHALLVFYSMLYKKEYSKSWYWIYCIY